MGQSKAFKGKTCAYCRTPESSASGDHVVARNFFFEEDRANLPKVPACLRCNREKSELENYFGSTVLIGSKLPKGDEYRRDYVQPRLARNARLSRELRLDAPPEWVNLGGIYQPMHAVEVDARKVNALMKLIVLGLYRHHFGAPLSLDFEPDASMYAPDGESALRAWIGQHFPSQAARVQANLGAGAFSYAGIQSPADPAFSVWEMVWHGGTSLHGQGAPPRGIDRWWAFTKPTRDAVAAERAATPR